MENFKPKLEQQVDRLREPFWAAIGAQRTSSAFLIVGLLADVGFTMSTFMAHLALSPESPTLASAKLAIVMASVIAAGAGFLVLRFWSRAPQSKPANG